MFEFNKRLILQKIAHTPKMFINKFSKIYIRDRLTEVI